MDEDLKDDLLPDVPKKKTDYLFKPGQSGNPAGRPKGTTGRLSIATRIAKELRKEGATIGGKSMTMADAIALVTVREAVGGHRWAIELVLKYMDGLPVSRLEIANTDGRPFMINMKPNVKKL